MSPKLSALSLLDMLPGNPSSFNGPHPVTTGLATLLCNAPTHAHAHQQHLATCHLAHPLPVTLHSAPLWLSGQTLLTYVEAGVLSPGGSWSLCDGSYGAAVLTVGGCPLLMLRTQMQDGSLMSVLTCKLGWTQGRQRHDCSRKSTADCCCCCCC